MIKGHMTLNKQDTVAAAAVLPKNNTSVCKCSKAYAS